MAKEKNKRKRKKVTTKTEQIAILESRVYDALATGARAAVIASDALELAETRLQDHLEDTWLIQNMLKTWLKSFDHIHVSTSFGPTHVKFTRNGYTVETSYDNLLTHGVHLVFSLFRVGLPESHDHATHNVPGKLLDDEDHIVLNDREYRSMAPAVNVIDRAVEDGGWKEIQRFFARKLRMKPIEGEGPKDADTDAGDCPGQCSAVAIDGGTARTAAAAG